MATKDELRRELEQLDEKIKKSDEELARVLVRAERAKERLLELSTRRRRW